MIDEFRKMGYTEEQSHVLEKLSAIGDDGVTDVNVCDAEKMLSDIMGKYQVDKEGIGKIIDEFNKIPN